jgi:hypothetical protein
MPTSGYVSLRGLGWQATDEPKEKSILEDE